MWISWHYLDPIMKDLDKLSKNISIVNKANSHIPYIDYSTNTQTLYAEPHKDSLNVNIKTIEQLNQVLLLDSLGITEYEIQQHIDLGITDGT